MISTGQRRTITWVAGAACVGLLLSGCSNGDTPTPAKSEKVTITVAMASDAPPAALMAEFEKSSGVTVKWSNIDFSSLQTKITTAGQANTYFADATNVDWSRVGQLGKLNWFQPLEKYLDTKTMTKDIPQITSFISDGHVVGIPYDSSFTVATVNKALFAKAGITTMPTTMDEYTDDLKEIKAKGVLDTPLNIPLLAVEGLSTYWYQTTAAFGGSVLNKKGQPQFASPDSAGYKAVQWMVDSYKDGLVPAGNINIKGGVAQQTLMAKGLVATTLSDYAGNVGNLYNVSSASTVVDQIVYLPTPSDSGVAGPNLSNPDGIGIPRAAKHPEAAAKFIKWFTSAKAQAAFSGADGADQIWTDGGLPCSLSALSELNDQGKLASGDQILSMLKNSQPAFAGGAPVWYPEFSRAVYTNIHAAAAGTMSVADAVKGMADTATRLSSGS